MQTNLAKLISKRDSLERSASTNRKKKNKRKQLPKHKTTVYHVDFKNANKPIKEVVKIHANGQNRKYSKEQIGELNNNLSLFHNNKTLRDILNVPKDKRNLKWVENYIDVISRDSAPYDINRIKRLLDILEDNFSVLQTLEKRGALYSENTELYKRLSSAINRLRWFLNSRH